MEHSEEILNVKCLEYSSPSWATSVLVNDQAIKWAKAKVCVYADSVLCVGQMKDSPGAIKRWKGQVEGLGFKDRIISMSMFNDIEWKTNDENCISNAEKVENYAMKSLDIPGSRVGRAVVWKFFLRSKRRMGFYSQQNGTAMPRNRSLDKCTTRRSTTFGISSHKGIKETCHPCLESWNLEAEEM